MTDYIDIVQGVAVDSEKFSAVIDHQYSKIIRVICG